MGGGNLKQDQERIHEMSRRIGLGMLVFIAVATCLRADEKPSPRTDTAAHGRILVQEARAHFGRQDWAKAVGAYEQVVRVNPYSGQDWYQYGFAFHSLARHDEAVKVWAKSVELGYQPANGLYNIACAHSLAGRKDEAIAWLQKAIDAGFTQEETIRTDADLDPIRADPRFKKIFGTPPERLSREERWRWDLDHLLRRMEKVHYNLYARGRTAKVSECRRRAQTTHRHVKG
jgi:tetratricopeptide (TPR) repeat protein